MSAARFWVFWRDSWVKLSVRQGQELKASHSAPDEEGFHYQWSIWRFDGLAVFEQWGNGGRDCDGRIDRCGHSVCHPSQLASVPAYDDGTPDCLHDGRLIMRPAWEEYKPVEIRDQYAEMANY